jgi:nitrate/nitrite-specific signal transduction histidine kinase
MKKNWWSSLQIKIIAWSFVPAVIILSAVAWFTFYSYQKGIGDLAIKQDREIVLEKATQAVQALNSMLEPVILPIFLEIDIPHAEPLEARAENILNQAQGLEIFDGGIYFLDQDGKVFKTYPERPELIGQDWSNSPQFRYVLGHNNVSATTDLLSIGSSGNKFICSVIGLIGQKGETVGAGYYCFTIYPVSQNAFFQALNGAGLGPNLYILDRNQRIIYSPDPSEIGKDLSKVAYIQQLLQGESRSGRFRNGTEDMLASYIPVSVIPDLNGWIVLKKQSWKEIMQPTLPYRQLLLFLLALGLIVPVLVTAYGIRRITHPIQELIHASAQVTAGQFKHRIEVKTGDEIETLADQFNLMSAELDDSYSSLEKKVADRTRELAILNSIISVASHSLDIQEILADALNQTVERMGFEAGAAYRLEADSMPVLLVACRGFEPDIAMDLANRYPITNQGDTAEVKTYDIEGPQGEKQVDHFHMLVSVPLSTKGHTLGLFLLGRRELVRLSPEELSLLNSIGKQVGVAMENAHLYEQAERAAVMAERTRLARELHDAVTQTLFSANLIADVIPRIWKRDPEEGMQNLEELRQLTRGALAEMRTLLLEMRPEALERSDLKSLLTQLADAFIGRVRVPVSLVIQGDCEPAQDVKLVFYRVAQESLNNIAKHSGARQVDLHLECQLEQLKLFIKDDGLGFEAGSIAPDHMGIAIMRERANSIGASLKIDSQVGQGTIVELDWRPARRD